MLSTIKLKIEPLFNADWQLLNFAIVITIRFFPVGQFAVEHGRNCGIMKISQINPGRYLSA